MKPHTSWITQECLRVVGLPRFVYSLLPFIILSVARAHCGDQSAGDSRNGNAYCGARCVKYLLEWYGQDDVDLISLIREIQWPDLESGATMQSLDQNLRAKGVFTCPLRLKASARLRWPYPVLVHIKQITPDGVDRGHYVVWLPSSTNKDIHIWDGLKGIVVHPTREFRKVQTGFVLLTSPAAIVNADDAVETSWCWDRNLTLGVVALLVGVTLLSRRGHFLCVRCQQLVLRKKT